MQQWIDCAMLRTDAAQNWLQPCLAGLEGGKVRVRVLDVKMTTRAPFGLALPELQGVHACLLPVCPDNLSWVRTLLGQARAVWSVPVVAMTHDLRAVALRDLFALRVADFMRVPACCEELRVRLERVLAQARHVQLDTLSRALASPAPVLRVHKVNAVRPVGSGDAVVRGTEARQGTSCADSERLVWHRGVRTYAMGRPLVRSRYREAEPARAHSVQQRQWVYAQPAELARPQTPAVQQDALEAYATTMATRCALYDEPLKQAKGRVVHGFEKAYVTAVLNRYGGNVTQAARAAQKNRRAFWELVRKHHIDLSSYRAAEQAPAPAKLSSPTSGRGEGS